MQKIVILLGGWSEERAVSLVSGAQIEKELQQLEYETIRLDPHDFSSYQKLIEHLLTLKPALVFNALHGAEGEDGRMQALLTMHEIAFTGSGYRACALAMDKIISSKLAKTLDIPVPEQLVLEKYMEKNAENTCQLNFPLVIKPYDSGSSCGISILSDQKGLKTALAEAWQYSDKAICEKFIPGRELTVSILGDRVLPVVEVKPKAGWYDYTNKYTGGNTVYEVPAKISRQEQQIIQAYAQKAFKLFGCEVYGRVDFRYDGKDFYFLEVNTLPGMTELSLTPMAAAAAGFSFGMLLEEIIQLSLNRKLGK
ncbi:MAG: D-alanine--D-alanine ligase [Candidatus Cloacimonadales bacterium]